MTDVVRSEILSSLASVREDVERHVAGLERYRALRAIEKTIEDFPDLDDLNRSLSEIRERVRRQIEDTPEARALRSVEKIMPELTEVLTFLAERTEKAAIGQAATDEDTERAEGTAAPAEPQADADGQKSDQVTVVIATLEEVVEASVAPQPLRTQQQETSEPELQPVANADPGDAPDPANDVGNSGASGQSVAPGFSYGIAQFLNPDDAGERPAIPETISDEEGLSQFRSPPSQEGRAA